MFKKEFVLISIFLSIQLVLALPNDAQTSIDFNYPIAQSTNLSSTTVNDTLFFRGLTPQQVANLFNELDPVFSLWLAGFLYDYNQSSDRVPYTGASSNVDLGAKNITTTGVLSSDSFKFYSIFNSFIDSFIGNLTIRTRNTTVQQNINISVATGALNSGIPGGEIRITAGQGSPAGAGVAKDGGTIYCSGGNGGVATAGGALGGNGGSAVLSGADGATSFVGPATGGDANISVGQGKSSGRDGDINFIGDEILTLNFPSSNLANFSSTSGIGNIYLDNFNLSASYYLGNGTTLSGVCLSNGSRCPNSINASWNQSGANNQFWNVSGNQNNLAGNKTGTYQINTTAKGNQMYNLQLGDRIGATFNGLYPIEVRDYYQGSGFIQMLLQGKDSTGSGGMVFMNDIGNYAFYYFYGSAYGIAKYRNALAISNNNGGNGIFFGHGNFQEDMFISPNGAGSMSSLRSILNATGLNILGDVNVTGNINVTNNVVINGNLSVKRAFFYGYDNSTQVNAGTTVANIINITNNADYLSWGINVTNNQNLTFKQTGVYICDLSPEFVNADATADIGFWMQKNGVDVAWSNSRYTMANNAFNAPSIPFAFEIRTPATDYVRFMWYSSNINTVIYSSGALTSPTRPSVPGVILNCRKSSEITPA